MNTKSNLRSLRVKGRHVDEALLPFPKNHWSTDWVLLDDISKEFNTIRNLYEWPAGVQDKTVTPHFQAIVENKNYPAIARLFKELSDDYRIQVFLDNLIEEYIQKRKAKWPSEEIRRQLNIRINKKCWVNSNRWILKRDEDEYWRNFLNYRNLMKDIERTERVLDTLTPELEPVVLTTPQPGILVVSNDVEEAGKFDHGYDFVDKVDQVIGAGKASKLEGKVFLDWYLFSDADADCDELIVAKYKLTSKQLYGILEKFACLLGWS